MRTVYLDGETLSTLDVYDVAYGRARAEIALDAMPKIAAARQVVENIIEQDMTVYGVNTGFGSLYKESIEAKDLQKLQQNLIKSHACGTGEEVPVEIVKLMLLLKVQSLCQGHSGVQLDTVLRLIDFYNYDGRFFYCD